MEADLLLHNYLKRLKLSTVAACYRKFAKGGCQHQSAL